MTYSVNEVEMLILKACRGAGVPLAQAQDVASCAAQSSACLQAVITLLNCPAPSPNVSGEIGLTFHAVHMLRDLPLAVDAVLAGVTPVVLLGVDFCDFSQAYCETHDIEAVCDAAGISLTRGSDGSALPAHRPAVTAEVWRQLDEFACKTYVPETEASRLAGAGAGLTDND